MEKHTLHEMLAQLHDELRTAQPLSDEEKSLLLAVQEDIRNLVEPPTPANAPAALAAADPQQQQTRGRLQEAAFRFEGSHPRLSNALESMLNALSNAGL